jgi:hypothetical protein
MSDPNQVEALICLISSMNRDEVIAKLVSFQGRFPIDFNHDYLSRQPLDRLQHIFLALCLQHSRTPTFEAAAA